MTATMAPTLQRALRHLADLDFDRARQQNGIGFSAIDGDFGHRLATIPDERMSPKQKRAAWTMLRKYRGQLADAGIDFDAIPEPPIVTEEVQRTYEESRHVGKRIIRPNASAPFVQFVFPYDRAFIAEFRMTFDGLRWLPDLKRWQMRLPNTPEGYRRLLDWAGQKGFTLADDLREYCLLEARRGDRAREASQATATDWQGKELSRTLYPFQRAGVRYMVEIAKGRGIIADEMGLGKSIQSIATIHELGAYPVLMITKASTKLAMRNEWLATIPGIVAEDVYVIGSKWDAAAADRAGVLIINYDLVTKHLDHLLATKLEALIVDESQRCRNPQAQRTQSILAIATGRKRITKGKYEKVREELPYRVLLTGTPIVNRPSELIPQLQIAGRLADLDGYQKFKDEYCAVYFDGYRQQEGAASPDKIAKLNHKMRAFCYVQRDKAAVAPELPAIQRQILPVELDRKHRVEYRKAELDVIEYVGARAERNQEFLATLVGMSKEDAAEAIRGYRGSAEERAARAETIVRINHCKQISGRGKIEAAKDWIAEFLESGQKLIVFCRHKEVQAAMLAEFPACVHILGDDSAADRDAARERFQTDPACRIILCATEAAGEGVTLTAASNVLFLELEWTPAAHLQAEARCYGRINDLHGANAYYMIATDTIDESLMDILGRKLAVCDALTSGEAKTRAAGESTFGDLVKALEARKQ